MKFTNLSKNQLKQRLITLGIVGFALVMIAAPGSVLSKLPNFPFQQKLIDMNIPLGLDIVGGTRLTYEILVPEIYETDQERGEIINGVRNVVEKRVNGLGISEANTYLSNAQGVPLLVVELPGVKDLNEAKARVGKVVLLEFKELADSGDPKFVKEIEDANAKIRRDIVGVRGEIIGKTDSLPLLQNASVQVIPQATQIEDQIKQISPKLLAALEKTEQGSLTDVLEVGNAYVFARMDGVEEKQNEVDASVTEKFFTYTMAISPKKSLQQWKTTKLSGKQFKAAQVEFQPTTGQPTVTIEFDDEGAELFGKITTRNVGKPVAIFLDGVELTAPTINEPIMNGRAVISGGFTPARAYELTRDLNTGAIPAPIKFQAESTMGGTLGREALDNSIKAGAIGFAILLIFMVVWYRKLGLVADAMLVLYAVAMISLFKVLGIVLTLAGMSAFILSVGMAVDANILIFERMKEELKSGKRMKEALDDGFDRAWSSIRDSNISSIITCAILFIFGASVIRGFAVTLGLGVIVSMFTAIFATRLVLQKVFVKK